ncbi:MAG TPA: sugar phosphate isomerase/epimerase family protein [Candidatus Hydrogenedentes bacterium]|nr:sugar phosphate isomerase/epimerase family protein [Candidatus Hydrogenedentota bacterium]HPG67497.1 sugar phosphate isomerase/epimerase family protein [Candidatus Hydrogenedentota bacterium]
MKRISIGTWAYSIGPYANNPVPWEEILRKLHELGFDGVELGGFGIHPNPDIMPTKEQRAACKQGVADAGLAFSGMAANLWGEHLIDTADNTHYLDEFRKNLEFCVDLGIPGIRVDTVQPPTIFEKVDADTARNRVVSTWKVCAREAADKGVYVTWEFEPGFAFNKPSDIIRIVDEVGDDNFGVQFDTCHAHMVAAVGARQPGKRETLPGGALELAQKLRGKINHLHLIDSDGTLHDDETSTHAPFGDGLLDFDTLLPELNRSGIPHDWWTIDLCFWHDAWVVTEQCKKAVDELNKKYG